MENNSFQSPEKEGEARELRGGKYGKYVDKTYELWEKHMLEGEL